MDRETKVDLVAIAVTFVGLCAVLALFGWLFGGVT